MTAFVLVLALCGIVATTFLTWVFLAVVGLVFVPVCIVTLVGFGTPVLHAIAQAVIGYTVLQVSYGLAGWGLDLFRGGHLRPGQPTDRADFGMVSDRAGQASTEGTGPERGSAADIHASMSAPATESTFAGSRRPLHGSDQRFRLAKLNRVRSASKALPLFGSWLPLAAFYDPPCHANGSPWDGVHDPGYRVTILVFGWCNRALSVRVGSPKPHRTEQDRLERDRAITAMDERVRRSRERASTNDERPPHIDG